MQTDCRHRSRGIPPKHQAQAVHWRKGQPAYDGNTALHVHLCFLAANRMSASGAMSNDGLF
jgi:hypothetical protein